MIQKIETHYYTPKYPDIFWRKMAGGEYKENGYKNQITCLNSNPKITSEELTFYVIPAAIVIKNPTKKGTEKMVRIVAESNQINDTKSLLEAITSNKLEEI